MMASMARPDDSPRAKFLLTGVAVLRGGRPAVILSALELLKPLRELYRRVGAAERRRLEGLVLAYLREPPSR